MVEHEHCDTDVLVVGGGLGGCAAALGAASLGYRVVLTEPTRWLGGQLTSQMVPPDEHCYIERFGCSARYRKLRAGVRQYYRDHYPLTNASRDNLFLNPGDGLVSTLCHEPPVAVAVLDQMLAWPRARGMVDVRRGRVPVDADTEADQVRALTFQRADGQRETVTARYMLDASERGDVLPLTGAEYVTGREAQSDTGEPNAPSEARPDDMQAITWCFAVSHHPGENHTIDKPAEYDHWRTATPKLTPEAPGPLLGWWQYNPHRKAPWKIKLFSHEAGDGQARWRYRRILAADHFEQPVPEISVINWAQNDYAFGSIIDVDARDELRHMGEARQLSRSLLYWLQTEAPRPDGGAGYPGLRLRPDQSGTDDGLAMAPYIRESRRIRAQFTVAEQHVGIEAQKLLGLTQAPPRFADSVGVGAYMLDRHMTTGGQNAINGPAWPYQIPLRAMIPVRLRNLLPACKNIGVTHIANACFRVHPTEWNIGEAAGLLAAYCLTHRTEPAEVAHCEQHVAEFQTLLSSQGVEIEMDWAGLRPLGG